MHRIIISQEFIGLKVCRGLVEKALQMYEIFWLVHVCFIKINQNGEEPPSS